MSVRLDGEATDSTAAAVMQSIIWPWKGQPVMLKPGRLKF